MAVNSECHATIRDPKADIDYRALGHEFGETAAREHISIRRHMNPEQTDRWIRDLWLRRVPEQIDVLLSAGARHSEIEVFADSLRSGYANHLRLFTRELKHAARLKRPRF